MHAAKIIAELSKPTPAINDGFSFQWRRCTPKEDKWFVNRRRGNSLPNTDSFNGMEMLTSTGIGSWANGSAWTPNRAAYCKRRAKIPLSIKKIGRIPLKNTDKLRTIQGIGRKLAWPKSLINMVGPPGIEPGTARLWAPYWSAKPTTQFNSFHKNQAYPKILFGLSVAS